MSASDLTPEQMVRVVMDAIADDLCMHYRGSTDQRSYDRACALGRIEGNVRQLARLLGLDDVAERLERDARDRARPIMGAEYTGSPDAFVPRAPGLMAEAEDVLDRAYAQPRIVERRGES